MVSDKAAGDSPSLPPAPSARQTVLRAGPKNRPSEALSWDPPAEPTRGIMGKSTEYIAMHLHLAYAFIQSDLQ